MDARQKIDHGRREKGDIIGAFQPATGDAFTQPCTGRTITHLGDFLKQVDARLFAGPARVYAFRESTLS